MQQQRRSVKSWLAKPPSVEEARPGCCPRCQAASRPVGLRLVVVGHGLRERQHLGPPAPNTEPLAAELRVRRYRCRNCNAVITVGPTGVLFGRHYSAAAIAWALALCGLLGLSFAEVRARVSPWRIVGVAAARSWVTLRRWVGAAGNGGLFPVLRRPLRVGTVRKAAAALAEELAGHALPEFRRLPLAEQTFWAAALAG